MRESWGVKPLRRSESKRRVHRRPIWIFFERFELERICWDPKDGELCLNKLKSEETLMEGCSGSDVQIDRQIWV